MVKQFDDFVFIFSYNTRERPDIVDGQTDWQTEVVKQHPAAGAYEIWSDVKKYRDKNPDIFSQRKILGDFFAQIRAWFVDVSPRDFPLEYRQRTSLNDSGTTQGKKTPADAYHEKKTHLLATV